MFEYNLILIQMCPLGNRNRAHAGRWTGPGLAGEIFLENCSASGRFSDLNAQLPGAST